MKIKKKSIFFWTKKNQYPDQYLNQKNQYFGINIFD